MTRKTLLIIAGIVLLLIAGCSDDDPVTPPKAKIYTAAGNFHNFLVADGAVDTRLSVLQGADINIANHIVPNGAAINRGLLLDKPQVTSSLSFFLSGGDGTILNPAEVFPLEHDQRYIFMALGNIYTAQGQLKPTLMQMPALAAPAAGKVAFRFTHALAGAPGPVDVHVNGQIITNLVFGKASATVTFDARAAGEDTLIIVPTGVEPDGNNEIWKDTGSTTFLADRDYESIMAHNARDAFNGDINGTVQVFLLESH